MSDWDDEPKDGYEKVTILREEVDERKSWLKAVADHDAMHTFDTLLEQICGNANSSVSRSQRIS